MAGRPAARGGSSGLLYGLIAFAILAGLVAVFTVRALTYAIAVCTGGRGRERIRAVRTRHFVRRCGRRVEPTPASF